MAPADRRWPHESEVTIGPSYRKVLVDNDGSGYAHWLDKDLTFYYPSTPANEYARYWHSIGINHRAYGMGYDDAGSNGPLVFVNRPGEKPEKLTVGIGS